MARRCLWFESNAYQDNERTNGYMKIQHPKVDNSSPPRRDTQHPVRTPPSPAIRNVFVQIHSFHISPKDHKINENNDILSICTKAAAPNNLKSKLRRDIFIRGKIWFVFRPLQINQMRRVLPESIADRFQKRIHINVHVLILFDTVLSSLFGRY